METERCCRAYFEQAYFQESLEPYNVHEANILGGDFVLLRRAWNYHERNLDWFGESRYGYQCRVRVVAYLSVGERNCMLLREAEIKLAG